MNMYRVLDANINRVSEGIRVLEDISRFVLADIHMTERLKEIRHKVRKGFLDAELLRYRNASHDVGYEISMNNSWDKKESIQDLTAANFKRAEEGLRSIEESLRVLGRYSEAKTIEALRFETYDLERAFRVKKRFLDTDIYAIGGEEFSLGRRNAEIVRELIQEGVKIFQYREKHKSKLEKYKECCEIRRLTEHEDILFIVNDDVDIAAAVGADGIHLGQEDISAAEVRKLAGNMIIGLSTHNKEQAEQAVRSGVDYIGVGPIFKTNTKKDTEHSDGLGYLTWLSNNISIPYVAIGGIKESNILEVKKCGGKCFAMISEIMGAESIKNKIRSIRETLEDA